jgi:nicotinamidase-related amidase
LSEIASCSVALLLIDVINGFDFEGCEPLVEAAERAAPHILALRERARTAGIPIVYVNDNFGQWRSDFRSTVAACSNPELPGHRVTQMLAPEPNDYFVLKPRHSGFFGTALQLLLDRLQARTLMMVGFATNICVLFTANDAHMRGYAVVVPRDCTASNSERLTEQALEQLRVVTRATTDESRALDFKVLAAAGAAFQPSAACLERS